MIVSKSDIIVEKENSTKVEVPTIGPAIIKASAESILAEEEDVFTTSLINGRPIPAQELKKHVSFRALMESDGHQIEQSGKYSKCRCPFHPDRTPSFCIYESNDYAKCYGCDWHGDIFKYEQEFHGVDFKQAWWQINDFVRNHPRAGRKARSAPKKTIQDKPQFTPRQLTERKLYAQRLATEPWLADLVCQRRYEATGEKWNSETIRQLAKDDFLGWAGGAVAFIYPRGTKYRDWPGREFTWESDGPSLWRGERLATATHVYLTESETDAIAVLHTNIEERAGVAVIAMSGVNSFDRAWASLFKEKVVTFCFDNDEAGEEGVEKIAPLLQPYAKQLRTVDLKEVA